MPNHDVRHAAILIAPALRSDAAQDGELAR